MRDGWHRDGRHCSLICGCGLVYRRSLQGGGLHCLHGLYRHLLLLLLLLLQPVPAFRPVVAGFLAEPTDNLPIALGIATSAKTTLTTLALVGFRTLALAGLVSGASVRTRRRRAGGSASGRQRP
jgi:hypothetical protein